MAEDEQQIPPSYWESTQGYRRVEHPVVAGFSRQRWSYLAGLLPLNEVRTALDVGCGNGFASHYAPDPIRCTVSDQSIWMLRQHLSPARCASDAERLPFADASFDLVFCWEVLHHVAEPRRVLTEMARVSRRWVVLFEPNPLNPAQLAFALIDRDHRAVLHFRRRYLLEELRAANLRCLAYRRLGLIFPNRSPRWLFNILIRLPVRIPLVGISQLVVAEIAR